MLGLYDYSGAGWQLKVQRAAKSGLGVGGRTEAF